MENLAIYSLLKNKLQNFRNRSISTFFVAQETLYIRMIYVYIPVCRLILLLSISHKEGIVRNINGIFLTKYIYVFCTCKWLFETISNLSLGNTKSVNNIQNMSLITIHTLPVLRISQWQLKILHEKAAHET